jgi:GAF domain-containing protein/nitrate/nitrite-specific signal transduction histidine kinase
MMAKQKVREKVDVGASRAAKGILGSLDRRLIQPAGILVRFSGWMLVITIGYMTIFETFNEQERRDMYFWLACYAGYMLILEIFRKFTSEVYDTSQFRSVRVLINLVLVSALVSIAPTERYLLILAYTVPIFATIVYYPENNWIKLGVYLLALMGLYGGGIIFINSTKLGFGQFLLFSFVLAGLSIVFEIFRRKVNLVPSRLTELAKELNKTLDLQQLMAEILEHSIDITQAQRGLIIIINPRNKRYVGHILHNFNLKEGCSIEDLAKKCFVLVYGQPFENPDMAETFSDKTVYHKFFDSQPRSVLAEPLHNRAGKIMGVINVAHNDPNGFDKISGSLLKEFAFLVSNAIENCFEHREVKLREAKSRAAGEKFVSAGSEDEAANILIEEVRQQIPHTEKLTVHQLLPKDHGLLPIHSYSLETTPKISLWSGPKPRKLKPDLRIGYGIAGHALELRDTILVPDVDDHPWYVQLDHARDIKSLLVAPLFDPQGNDLYGTISLESAKPSAFSLEDESTLTYLSTQTSRAIAKIRDFQAWREQGGTLRRMLEQIGSFDINGTESALCEQIAEAATGLLGFKIASIRLLIRDDNLVTVAVTGVSENTKKRLLNQDLPFAELIPFLVPNFKAESSYLIKHGTPGWKRIVDKYFLKPRLAKQNNRSWDAYDALITPLLDPSGNTIGILTLDAPNSGSEPNKQTLELIGVFANAASWVLELSWSQKYLADQQSRAQSFIYTISQELAKGRDIPTISEVVVQAGAKLLSAEGCSLYLVRGNDIELTHSNYLANTDYITRRKPISSLPKSGLTAWVASTGETICFNRREHSGHPAWAGDEDHLEFLPSKICKSLLIAPVKDKEGKVIAVLKLENKKTITGPMDFDKGDERRLQSLANEFAKALEVIGLYEDIREWEHSGLADDIHDLINWHHSGIVSWIEALEEWLRRSDYQKVKELAAQVRQHALSFVQELKTLHTNFLAKSLEAPTFRQALEETLSAWTKRVTPKYEKERMRINFNCPENLEIPVKIRNTIIRFASLAFSNAIQHSGITENPEIEVYVNVEQKDRKITLTVVDNGRGIDYRKNPPGFGMDRMKQLAAKINNWGDVQTEFQIQTEVNQGTKVMLTLRATT